MLCSCIMGQQPGTFDAQRGQLLANLAEMLVRQLEVKWVTALQVRVLLITRQLFRITSLLVDIVDAAGEVGAGTAGEASNLDFLLMVLLTVAFMPAARLIGSLVSPLHYRRGLG
jgi:hypothetical protein